MSAKKTLKLIKLVCKNLIKFLEHKNKKYGNSVIKPIRIFSKSSANEQVLDRIDDKLSRIRNSSELRKNDVVDLLGYLIFVCILNGWLDFDDLID